MKTSLALAVAFMICNDAIVSTVTSDLVVPNTFNSSRRSSGRGYPNSNGDDSETSYGFPSNQQPTESKHMFQSQNYGNTELGYEPGLRPISTRPLGHPSLSSSYDVHSDDQEQQGGAVIYSDAPAAGNTGPGTKYNSGRYFNFDQIDPSQSKNHLSIKKKYGKAGSTYGGGWDDQPGFNSAGPWFGGGGSGYQGGSGFADAAGLLATKKAAGAKALFVLIVPLILLAVFGPILAGQALIPWLLISGGTGGIAGGGAQSVATTAVGGRGKRSIPGYLPENSSLDPRQVAELEKRLRVFMAVQEYIAQTGSEYSFQNDISAAYMKCRGYLESDNQCLERVACEYADKKSAMNAVERRITGMVLQNIMTNRNLPATIRGRLSKGAMFGRTHSLRCASFFCEIVDGKKKRS